MSMTNIYHITYAPEAKQVYLHFWGCNMRCRGCLCQKEIYDCHLEATRERIFAPQAESPSAPNHFLSRDEVQDILTSLNFKVVIFMGMEPTIDPELPLLAKILKEKFCASPILLTNGLKPIPLTYIDQTVVSIKAYHDELHRDYTGVSNQEILKNFCQIYSQGKNLRAESVFIPDYVDKAEIGAIARFIAGIDRAIPYRIDAYFPAGNNPWRRAGPKEVEEAVKEARKYLLNVSSLKGDEELNYSVIRIY